MRRRILGLSDRVHGWIRRHTHPDEIAFYPLEPERGGVRGRVLLAYIAEPFADRGRPVSTGHTHFGESVVMAETLLEMGYAVDVISYRNTSFRPRRRYDLFIGARVNFERVADRLNDDCVKIVHLDMAHWLFNNTAAYQRNLDLQRRRGVTLAIHRKQQEQNWAVERADYATVLGNAFTTGTYAYAGTPLFQIGTPSAVRHPWPEEKDFDAARNRYLWVGSDGLVHKGLDLVLEAFAAMPDHHLTVCGPISNDPRFQDLYRDLLYGTANIETVDWIDVSGDRFRNLADASLGVVYPSASEAQAGSVVTCMHASLVPVVSYQTGFDVGDFGVIVDPVTIASIREHVGALSALDGAELRRRARATWETARELFTREAYERRFREIIEQIEADRTSRPSRTADPVVSR